MTKTALILGATGRFASHTERALQQAGWKTRRFDRSKDDLTEAAKGADVIVYGWNPPYNKWKSQAVPLLQQAITAAHLVNATILFPGNVYVYGQDNGPVLRETTPHAARNELGRIRIEMETLLQSSSVKTIILRAGDYIDSVASGNWFDGFITKDTQKSGKISYPGTGDIPHAWAFLPDVARAAAELVEKRAGLPRFCAVNFAGYTMSGTDLANHLGARFTKMSWLPIIALRPFWPVAKHLLEMRYLWNMPNQITGETFDKLLPDFEPTPIKRALAIALSFQIDPDQPMVRTGATV